MATIYVAPGERLSSTSRTLFLGEWVAETDASLSPDVVVGQRVYYQGNVYEVIINHDINAGSTPPDSDTTNWRLVEGTFEDPYKSADLDEEALSQLTDSDELILLDGTYNFFGFSKGTKNDAYPANGKPVLKSLNRHGAKIYSARFSPANFLCSGLEVFDPHTQGVSGNMWPLGNRIGFHYSGCILHTSYFWPPLNCIVENCLIHASLGSQGLFYGAYGQILAGHTVQPEDKAIRFIGNTVIINTTAGSTQKIFSGIINQGTPNPVFDRNIFYVASNPNSSSDWNFYQTANMTNCIAYDSTGSATTTGLNDVTLLDPLFIDINGGDLRLRPTSPCIGGSAGASKESLLEAEYPNGKWFDSNAAPGGDGTWATPYDNYGEAIDSFTGDEAVILVKEGQHALYTGYLSGTTWGTANDLPKEYPGGIKVIGMGKGSVFYTADMDAAYPAFYCNHTDNPNLRNTPFLLKDFDFLLDNTSQINRGIWTVFKGELINVNIDQADGFGKINSCPFDYHVETNVGTSLKVSSCLWNITGYTPFYWFNNKGLKEISGCTFADLNRSIKGSAPSSTTVLRGSTGQVLGSYIKDCIFYSENDLGPTSIGALSAASYLVVSNTLFHSTVKDWSGGIGGTNVTVDNVLLSDPKFVETSDPGSDLRLRPDSPLIGGVSSSSSFPSGSIWVTNTAGTGGTGTEEDPYYFESLDQAYTDAGSFGSVVFKNGTYDATVLGGTIPWELGWAFNKETQTNNVNYYAETIGGVEFIGEKIIFGHSGLNVTQSLNYTGLKITSTNTTADNFVFDQSAGNSIAAHVLSSCELQTNHSFLESNGMATKPGKVIFRNSHLSKVSATNHAYLFEQRNGNTVLNDFLFENCIIENFLSTSGGPSEIFRRVNGTLKNTIIIDYSNSTTGLSVGATDFNLAGPSCIIREDGTDLYLNELNIAVDPLFVAPIDGNWNLRPFSPLIGQG